MLLFFNGIKLSKGFHSNLKTYFITLTVLKWALQILLFVIDSKLVEFTHYISIVHVAFVLVPCRYWLQRKDNNCGWQPGGAADVGYSWTREVRRRKFQFNLDKVQRFWSLCQHLIYFLPQVSKHHQTVFPQSRWRDRDLWHHGWGELHRRQTVAHQH